MDIEQKPKEYEYILKLSGQELGLIRDLLYETKLSDFQVAMRNQMREIIEEFIYKRGKHKEARE